MAKGTSWRTPGVYIQELPALPPSISTVETCVPAFVGYTQKDETNLTPVRIHSFNEYEALFGTASPLQAELTVLNETISKVDIAFTNGAPPALNSFLFYSIQMFFHNGGESCYIASAGLDFNVPDINELRTSLNKLEAIEEITLIVIPDAVVLPDALCYDLMNDALAQCSRMRNRFFIADVKINPGDIANRTTPAPVDIFRSYIQGDASKAKYGAAYYPYLHSILNYNFSDDSLITLKDPGADKTLDILKSTRNDLYNKIKIALKNIFIDLPPSGSIAGIYAMTDRNRGTWKAPANVQVTGITGPSHIITMQEQEGLNVDPVSGKSINAIRQFTGRGTLVWGARTLAGNDNEWRYISVCRLFIIIESSVKKGLSPFVFEPNDSNTWTRVKGMIENYLTSLWRAGALQGAKPEHAFYVRTGLGETMTAADIQAGTMIIDIGLAVVRPAEFIIMRITQQMQA